MIGRPALGDLYSTDPEQAAKPLGAHPDLANAQDSWKCTMLLSMGAQR